MKHSKHTIAYIKRQAKNFKKQQAISHTQALDLISKKHGYSNWKHCHKMLSQNPPLEVKVVTNLFHVPFTDWLKKHKNRNSPLGDLATDMLRDKEWPSHNSFQDYQDYLHFKNASIGATAALKMAWRTYIAYLKKKNCPVSRKSIVAKPSIKNHDLRKIVVVRKITPLHYAERTVEKFVPGDKAWISWDGRKAYPVTITKVDERHYTFKIERPLKNAGSEHFLFLDEVRSTPELACINFVTS
ncbi:YozE family protein [Ferruginibacter paludis]|uniref:YozE family protein n=1 Tax=Ferruginibacter paludis TaxID=1310417 RepID=UPI0025B35686|nr:YozE family protein [Ferruginibacter paludis]MDN3655407.1 YozE family protein [Ferruginibacter paludis]